MVLDKPTIKSYNTVVYVEEEVNVSVDIDGGYFYSTNKTAIGIYGNGDITNSILGNGSSNDSTNDAAAATTVSHGTTGDLTLNNSKILAGPYAASAIIIYSPITLNCTGNTSIYASNTTEEKNSIKINTSGATVTFNSTGYFYCTSTYVVNASSYSATFNVTKGNFASRNNKYMFYKSGAAVATYASSNTTSSRSFTYMNSYNSTTTISISDCYYYSKGI